MSRALVEIFNHDLLGAELRFRGGTALNKIVFPEPLRYSEDIDLVRTSAGPIGPILGALRDALESWLGKGSFAPSRIAPRLHEPSLPALEEQKCQIKSCLLQLRLWQPKRRVQDRLRFSFAIQSFAKVAN